MEVNGKIYPMWGGLVERSKDYEGGTLKDFGDSMDRRFGMEPQTTTIKSIQLVENGKDSAMLCIVGEEFECSGDVEFIGITGETEKGWLTFSGYSGHKFSITSKERKL